MIADTGFKWLKKSLGEPDTVPSQCYLCGAILSRKGWIKWDNMVNCLDCGHTFEV